jgi:hypothetical protein
VRPDDFNAFSEQASVLCAGFNVPATPERIEAYWRGLQKMDLMVFTRAVELALGEGGAEKFPTVPQMWNLAKRLRAPPQIITFQTKDPLVVDDYVAFANRRMLRYLMRYGAASAESLRHMVAEKNRLARAFREIGSEESVTEQEFADELLKAWNRVWREKPVNEPAFAS